MTENARFRFPGGHCKGTDFITDLWGHSKGGCGRSKGKGSGRKEAGGAGGSREKEGGGGGGSEEEGRGVGGGDARRNGWCVGWVCVWGGSPWGRGGGRM